MRLLRTDNLEFEEFGDDNVPPHVILSHTWYKASEEITYYEMCSQPDQKKPGYRKIRDCATIAAINGYEYVWIDTCCIDKTSSAELSEAINSMYLWYSTAAVCYAYLYDVPDDESCDSTAFASSKWFTRGWTLQELIAPKDVMFYNSQWVPLGTKQDLKGRLQDITGIPHEALGGQALSYFSIAEKMSWASQRTTSRIEDRAYSLMGIFDMNMPLLYGEKEKAFYRLQKQILEDQWHDQSIFAWSDASPEASDETVVLAKSPSQFRHCGDIKLAPAARKLEAPSLSSLGLRLTMFLMSTDPDEVYFVAPLFGCCYKDSRRASPGIYLKRITSFKENWRSTPTTLFSRTRLATIKRVSNLEKNGSHDTVVHLAHRNTESSSSTLAWSNEIAIYCHWVWSAPTNESVKQFLEFKSFPAELWDNQNATFNTEQKLGVVGCYCIQYKSIWTVTIFGFKLEHDFHVPWITAWTTITPDFEAYKRYEPTGYETSVCQVDLFQNSAGRTVWDITMRQEHSNEYTIMSHAILLPM